MKNLFNYTGASFQYLLVWITEIVYFDYNSRKYMASKITLLGLYGVYLLVSIDSRTM